MIDNDLIAKFAATFARFGEIVIPESTEPAALVAVYSKLPAGFPPLYEKLVLSYRWKEVDFGFFRLLANPPHNDLSGLTKEIFKDSGLAESLIPGGFIQFGKGPDINYDPVCFDIKNRHKDGDYRIVQIDHEEILCNYRIRIVAELALSFRDLVHKILSMQV
jgi:hypothetical protein